MPDPGPNGPDQRCRSGADFRHEHLPEVRDEDEEPFARDRAGGARRAMAAVAVLGPLVLDVTRYRVTPDELETDHRG
jgi:hypothetical protein